MGCELPFAFPLEALVHLTVAQYCPHPGNSGTEYLRQQYERYLLLRPLCCLTIWPIMMLKGFEHHDWLQLEDLGCGT